MTLSHYSVVLGAIVLSVGLTMCKPAQSQLLEEPANSNVAPSYIPNYRMVEQNWDMDQRLRFWFTPQGSYIMPYDWFLSLKDGDTLFKDKLYQYGYLPFAKHPDYNPDGLPIGFTKEMPTNGLADMQPNRNWLGLTCAGCHVGMISHNGQKILIEGAPSPGDFEAAALAVQELFMENISGKNFAAFQARINARGGNITREEAQMFTESIVSRNTRSFVHNGRPVGSGPGRVDAFGVILNEVTARDLGILDNAKLPDAPVSYPYLWGASHLQWVQWNGLSTNPFTRNIGEVLGVFGKVNLDPASEQFLQSTVKFRNLIAIENLLRELQPPKWQEVFGALKNPKLAAKGERLFDKHCESCHYKNRAPITTPFGTKLYPVELTSAQELGTDPEFFRNLAERSASRTGPLQGNTVLGLADGVLEKLQFADPRLKERLLATLSRIPPQQKQEHAVRILGEITNSLSLKFLADEGIAIGSREFVGITNGASLERQPVQGAYIGRPLAGIWASAPYLHNGSIRTLAELLTPPGRREKSFRIGSSRFDTKAVGFVSKGNFIFDTSLPGNRNSGHDYGTTLTDIEKEALIAYMKTL